MKNLLTLTLILALTFSWLSSFAQCDPDVEAPTFTVPDSPIFVASWDDVPSLSDVTDIVYATLEDNCLSPDVAPWYGPTMISGVFAESDNYISYEFSAYDDGPNYAAYQYVTYFVDPCDNDTIPPYFETLPEFNVVKYDCNNPFIEELTAADNSGLPVQITHTVTPSIYCGCPSGEYTGTSYFVTYIAIDFCGNPTSVSAHISVNDTTPPFTTQYPAEDLVVLCDSMGNLFEYNTWLNSYANMVAYDNCSEVTYEYNVLDSMENCYGYNRKVEFIGSDYCGNVVRDTAIFEISLMLIVDEVESERGGLKVYPNPNYGHFIIESDKEYKIYDTLGEEVDGSFSPGTYFIKTEDDQVKMVIL